MQEDTCFSIDIMDEIKAQLMLLKCRGDEIWSVETCRTEGVPPQWIEELTDVYESGFDSDCNTIYENGRMVNQYEGVQDLRLAYKLAEFLGVDWQAVTQLAMTREGEVRAIKEAAEEG